MAAFEPLEPGPSLWSDHFVVRPLGKGPASKIQDDYHRHERRPGRGADEPQGRHRLAVRVDSRREPSSFGEDQGPRQNACLAMERDSDAWAWGELEKRCVNEPSSRSSRIWGEVAELPQGVPTGSDLIPEAQTGRRNVRAERPLRHRRSKIQRPEAGGLRARPASRPGLDHGQAMRPGGGLALSKTFYRGCQT